MVDSFLFQYSFSYLFGGTVFAILAVFVFLKAPEESLNKVFAFYCFCVAWWSFFSILMINSPTEFWGTFWDRLCLMGVVLIPPTFIHFNYILLGYMQKYRWFILTNYIVSGFFFIANLTPFFVNHTSPKFGLNYYTDPGPLYLPFVAYFFSLSFFTFFVLFFASRRATGRYKKQVSLLFWAALLGYSMGGNNYNLSFGIGPAFLAAIGNLGVVAYGLIVAYTITKHRLLDISVIISRFVAEFIAIFILGTIYLFMVWLYWVNVSVRIDIPFIVITIIFGILVGQFYQRLRLFFQTTSDKLFLRGKYDYYDTLSEASTRAGEKLSIPSILNILYDVFYNAVEISNPQVFLPEYFTEPGKVSKRYLIYDKETFKPNKKGGEIGFDDPMVKQLIESRAPICDPKNPCRELVIPCLLENRLIAIFVLGRKLSEDPYTDEDINLLEGLASQAAIALDHTRSYEKIKTDLEAAEKVLARSQRLASLGTLIAGVTHEIRNPLTVIRSETERLANQARDQEYLKNYRDLLLKHIDRISGIVQRMLGLAKEKPKKAKSIDLREVIEQTLQFFVISRITVKQDLKPVSMIKANEDEMHEVFVNLIQNAIEAMPGGGTLTLKTYMENDRIVAEVSDTGSGIPEDIQEKIFDPFYSTRHEGVGLGLSIVYRIVREHDGDVVVNSKPGDGTTFKLLF
ncbi:MAG: hypothetical protein KKA31_04495 [Candidatus Margulisbacteria bacterium]|nr:hypothetical protein [Candidatus Margulisiibacteriota bacterium]